MKEKLSLRQYMLIGTMLFGMFFGAGNLIVPPMTGKLAGEEVWSAMFFFSITAVALPVLGVVAVAKAGSLKNLAERVSPRFAGIFTAAIYLSIGPVLAIPRASTVAFEMGAKPYLPAAFSERLALFLYSLLFFAIVYWLALNPSKLVERLGKIITPTLLGLMLILFATALITGMPAMGAAATTAYQEHPGLTGLIDGYMTMDTIAALNFGIVISMVIRDFQVTEEKAIVRATVRAGGFAGLLLAVIYFILAYLGASGAGLFADATNGAQILSRLSNHLFGWSGAILTGAIFTLACLSVSVGLVTSSGEYFAAIYPRFSYKAWVSLWTLLSLAFANIGLDAILKYNVTVLYVLYPIAIVLIFLALVHYRLPVGQWIYRLPVYTAMIISGVAALATELGIEIPLIYPLFARLPLHEVKLSWLLPVLVVFGLTWALQVGGWELLKKKFD
ncbi:branched-chain amino acid transport system II carrier protein [Lachnospiraceae bacterium oral taxon 500]|nr:branched-chain amino acid transport system II carrier protein [Lachnospiraceae bacterium oral taxon 500]